MDTAVTATAAALAPQSITTEVLQEKYCQADLGEHSAGQVFERVARAVASVEPTPELRAEMGEKFRLNMLAGAIGAGRIMASAGAGHNATFINCFVQPVGDAAVGYDEDGVPGIYTALSQASETLRRGGGVGYNFSAIRPKGALVKGTNSDASGPCTFMDVFDASCRTVMAAGSRRGAQMGILNIDHPDVQEFIEAKRTKGRWNNFNVSVGVTKAFMQALAAQGQVQLVHKARPTRALIERGAFQREDGLWVYQEVSASALWDRVMRSAYDYAEPGIIFLDRVNEDNNLRYCEEIVATNPCGEQPLCAYGCCDLGPIILPSFVQQPFTPAARFDEAGFIASVRLQVRFLDNVLDATPWPLKEQHEQAMAKRRIGVGFTGMGNALAMLNLRYDSEAGRREAAHIAELMRDAAYAASIDLAIERGPFPALQAEAYLAPGTFASRLPEALKTRIREHGIRNSHLLSIAPTGTVSLAFADNASNGIEPPFSLAYTRNKRTPDGGTQAFAVVDHGLRVFLGTLEPAFGNAVLDAVCRYQDEFSHEGQRLRVSQVLPDSMVTALAMSCDDHLAMMGAVQPFIDTAISKTVNVPADYPFDDFKKLYLRAHAYGLKGCATYRPNDTLGAVLEVPTTAATNSAPPGASPGPAPAPLDMDPLRISIEKRPEGETPAVTEKLVYHTSEGQKSLYLVVSFVSVEGFLDGQSVTVERPLEVFIPAGQNDEAQQWVTAVARVLSLTARDGRLPKALADLRKVTWDKGPVRSGYYRKADGTRVPRFHSSEVAAIAYAVQQILYRRGFLDDEGRVIPALRQHASRAAAPGQAPAPAPGEPAMLPHMEVTPGKPCPECGAHALVKKDGCEFCTHCGYLGSCG